MKRYKSLDEIFEFGRYKLASGLIVNTKRGQVGGRPAHWMTIKDPDSGTTVNVGRVKKSEAKGQGSTWRRVDIESSGVSMGRVRTKSELRKNSGKKIIRELAKHAAHTKKKGRPLRIKRTQIVNQKLANALEKAYKNPRFSKTVGDIEVFKQSGGRKTRQKGNAKDRKAEGRRRGADYAADKRERQDRRLDEQGRLTEKRAFRTENQLRKSEHYILKSENHPKRSRRSTVLIKDKNRA
jgi:hypothetical protein